MNPSIRFKGELGEEYPNWYRDKLRNKTFKVSQKNKKGELLPIYSISNKYGFILQSEQFEGLDSMKRGYDTSMYKIVDEDTYAYNPARINVGSIGYSGTLKRIQISSLYVCFKTTNDLLPDYFSQFLKSQYFLTKVRRSVEGGVRQYLFYDNFGLIDVPIPVISEQKKIGKFLNLVDQKINLLTKKKVALETYKKGLMQKIFSQEFRFKQEDGTDYPEWEIKKGDELFSNISDKNHNGDLPILAITQNYGAIPREMIDYDISVEDKSIMSYKIVERGDFIISLRSFQGGIEYSDYRGICSPAYIILRSNQVIESRFFKAYFKTHNLIQQINSKLEGIRDGKMLSYKYFSELNLPYPSIEEQKHIGNLLSAIDEKLSSTQKLLDENAKMKKGLLQQMFV